MSMLLALALLTPEPAINPSARADTPAPRRAAGQRPRLDPNQLICRREREPGHRTVIRRTCMTRSEWAEYRRELRDNVDRAQMTRVHPGH